jgi:hypothetical protein
MAIQFLVQLAEELTESAEGIGIAPVDRVLNLIAQFGFFKVVLPFLLTFAIVYGVLMKTGVLGEPDKAWVKPVAASIAFAVGFFVVAYTPVVTAIQQVVPQAGFLIILVILMMMILTMLGISFGPSAGKWNTATVIGVLVVIAIFVAMVGAVAPIPSLQIFSQFMMGMIPIELTEQEIVWLVAAALVIGIPIAILYLMYTVSE